MSSRRPNYSYVNRHGVRVNVREIDREGHSKSAPPRGQGSHNPSFSGHLIYRSLPHMRQQERNRSETRRRRLRHSHYRELQRARNNGNNNNNNNRRGPKSTKRGRR